MAIPELEEMLLDFKHRIGFLTFWKKGKCEEALEKVNDKFDAVEGKVEIHHTLMIAINNEFQAYKEFYEEGVYGQDK